MMRSISASVIMSGMSVVLAGSLVAQTPTTKVDASARTDVRPNTDVQATSAQGIPYWCATCDDEQYLGFYEGTFNYRIWTGNPCEPDDENCVSCDEFEGEQCWNWTFTVYMQEPVAVCDRLELELPCVQTLLSAASLVNHATALDVRRAVEMSNGRMTLDLVNDLLILRGCSGPTSVMKVGLPSTLARELHALSSSHSFSIIDVAGPSYAIGLRIPSVR